MRHARSEPTMCEYKRGLLTSLLGAREVNESGQLTSLGDCFFFAAVKAHSSLRRIAAWL